MVAALPAFAFTLIEALGGVGSLPCWMSAARCETAAGSAGPAAPWAPAAAGAGLLMTVLMTVVLWMLLKMMLLRGAAT